MMASVQMSVSLIAVSLPPGGQNQTRPKRRLMGSYFSILCLWSAHPERIHTPYISDTVHTQTRRGFMWTKCVQNCATIHLNTAVRKDKGEDICTFFLCWDAGSISRTWSIMQTYTSLSLSLSLAVTHTHTFTHTTGVI